MEQVIEEYGIGAILLLVGIGVLAVMGQVLALLAGV